jgi:hypothetical protein
MDATTMKGIVLVGKWKRIASRSHSVIEPERMENEQWRARKIQQSVALFP